MMPSASSLFAETLGASSPALALLLADRGAVSLPKEKALRLTGKCSGE